MGKNSFVLYTDYLEQIEMLSMEQRGLLFTAIMLHQVGEELPELDGMTKMAFAFIKSGMDRDTEKYKKICEARSEAGKRSGQSRTRGKKILRCVDGREIPQEEQEGVHYLYLIYDTGADQYKIGETKNLYKRHYTIRRPTCNLQILDFYVGTARECQDRERKVLDEFRPCSAGGDWFTFTEDQANEVMNKYFTKGTNAYFEEDSLSNETDNENESDSENDSENVNEKKHIGRFTPPTAHEVREYVRESGHNIDVDTFIDFYESKGWMVGKNKMKDWKAAVRNWSRSGSRRQGEATKGTKFSYEGRKDIDFDALERAVLRK